MEVEMKTDYEKILNSYFGDGDDNHYVYALCDSMDKIFYIGEGTGSRCLAHTVELEKEQKEIEKLPEEERKRKLEEFSQKKKMIEKIGAENVKHIILKYGLSQGEGFIAESAIINTLKAMGVELTNIVNGHATPKEKESKGASKTKARDLETFVIECAPEKLDVMQIKKEVLEKTVFISIGKLYSICNGNRDLIWEAVRGCWSMSSKKANKCKYVLQ